MTSLRGTGALARLVLRRDRVLLPIWVYVVGILPVSFAVTFADLYPTPADRARFAATSAHNGAFTALYGRLSGSSLGELVTWRGGFIPVVVGLISLLAVIRHTRTEEEAGRRELVGSTVVGRQAGLAAALAVVFAANLGTALLTAVALSLRGLPVAGSVAVGLEWAAAGWIFAGVGAVAAQLTTSAGAARGIGVAVLAASYAARILGDRGGSATPGGAGGALEWLSWFSPIGLLQRVHPFAGPSGARHWWVFAVIAGIVAGLVAVATALSARRDLGAGLLPDRLGPATARPAFGSPLALAWRLHRGLLAGWVAGFALLGVVFGGVASGVTDLVGDNPGLRDVFTRLGGRAELVSSYLASIMSLLGMIAAGYAIQAVLRLRAEEASGRAEPVLTTAVGRLRWATSHLVFAVLGPALAMLVAGAVTGLVYGANSGDIGHETARGVSSAGVQLPAVAVLAALALALFGLVPRLWPVSWATLAACLLIGLVGSGLNLSHWLLDVSPFTHATRPPGGSVTAVPLAVLCVLAVALGAAGLAGLRRRDIPVA
ncbi:ABC transporter permease [Pseudofrankia sp. BMG5.37]|uniref:ABC transporter permease n=1 Tax=Pseudofrankia sp. BMG5.37 TaxID=3050035 RepID=UPI002894C052|nr:ABC transporter permease [Pseudofrankia sp. BMG5.37]MDT3443995.1 ABC transporter permease [Pseudofrankia sp. BMG5.37]